MIEQRFVITDQLWQRIEPHLPGKVGDAGATAKGQSPISGSGLLAGAHWVAVARFATCFWQLEQPVPEVSSLGHGRRIRKAF
ncbi:hypothetical protein [Celeribacter sp.]|uniref:hypothetical protein n=1 Tax=Celeribacter sp. TaxID=1890673 RepID=UPI003A93B0BB